MDNDREIERILMSVKDVSGTIISTALFSAKMSFHLLSFLMRLAKSGLVASGLADRFKNFMEKTGGNYTVYNIPLSLDKAEKISLLNQLDLKLQETKNPTEKAAIRKEIEELKKGIPEIAQLKSLGIHHCVLPKLNQLQSIQVAIDKKDDQIFKNWFSNNILSHLSGGEKPIQDLKAFTEGHYTIFNFPMEGKQLEDALSDFTTLDINYTQLPDLNIGDGYSQVAIPNAERHRLDVWIRMWKDKQLRAKKNNNGGNGNDGGNGGDGNNHDDDIHVIDDSSIDGGGGDDIDDGNNTGGSGNGQDDNKEIYAISYEGYMDTAKVTPNEYISQSDQAYQQANEAYEKNGTEIPIQPAMGKENSQEFVDLLQDDNYQKISINKQTLADENTMKIPTALEEMRKQGYFISYIPGTHRKETLILPTNQVFKTDNNKTYIVFLPKNQGIRVADEKGNISEKNFQTVYQNYQKVERGFRKVQNLQKTPPNLPDAPTPPKPPKMK